MIPQKNRRKIELVILIVTFFLNYWIWRILSVNFILAIILGLLTFFLYRLFLDDKFKIKITVILFIIASSLNMLGGFDTKLLSNDWKDNSKINDRHYFYFENLGKLYNNKISIYLYNNILPTWYKFEENLFSVIDLNLYFFNSHPREREGVEEFKKYPFLLIPFFLIGLVYLVNKRAKLVLVYAATTILINGFISADYKVGPILFFPLISLFIFFGILICGEKAAKYLS